MRIAVAGGGTGGHIYPAVAVVEALVGMTDRVEVAFIGTRRGLESGIVPGLGYRIHRIVSRPLPGKISIDLFLSLACACVGFLQSVFILAFWRPNVVIGTGGYASGPFVLAASLLGVHTLLIEPNIVPGRTTMLLARCVDEVALGFPESVRHFTTGTNLRVTGVPVRRALITSTREDGLAKFGLDPKRNTVLVFGGSRGAHSINQAFVGAAEELAARDDLQFLVQTGQKDFPGVREAVSGLRIPCRVHPYIDDIGLAYAVSDLVVCRAGASTMTELTVCGLASILIPYPHATAGHQTENAAMLEKHGAAVVIKDETLTGKLLAETIIWLISDRTGRESMSRNSRAIGKPDASREVATHIIELARSKGRLAKLATVLGDICSVR